MWDPHDSCQVKKLEGVQRKAARYVQGNFSKYDSVTLMINKLGWQSLETRRKINRLGGIFKVMNRDLGWDELRNRVNTPNYIGRYDHYLKIKIRAQRTDIGKFSFMNRGISEWNKLDESLLKPLPKSAKFFRKKLNKYFPIMKDKELEKVQ